jgi:uncharacterized protein
MEVRKVVLDFADARVHWNPAQPEYSHLLNAISSFIPALEGFLNRTVKAARDRLPETETALRRDAEIFVAQEIAHTQMHLRFNRMLHEAGYDWLAGEVERMKADFKRFTDVKGHRFSLAYSEGFETFGPFMVSFFFDHGRDLMRDWHEPTCYLWLWHFSEEYEHRTVCNYLYRDLYGGYFYRIGLLWYAFFHLFGYAWRTSNRFIRDDRRSGAIPDTWRSRWRHAKVIGRFFGYLMPRLLFRAMSPRFDPGRVGAPPQVMAFLADASRKYQIKPAGADHG